MYGDLFNLMAVMLLMMAAGLLLMKAGLISREGKQSLVNIILYLILPCNIINAFCI